MRIVFDTNVLFAAFLSSGLCAELYESARDLDAIWISGFIENELREKLLSKARFSKSDTRAVLAMIRRDAKKIKVTPLESPVCSDPDDDWILATALAAGADCIVTGDKDLLVLGKFRDVPILDPRRCLELLLKQS